MTDPRKRLEQIALSWRSCTDCALSRSRRSVVFYRGNPDAKIAIVGEAPGHDEDLRGVPFVGQTGKAVDALLTEAKVAFDDVCFLNVVGCRPPNDRAPRTEEANACQARTLGMLNAIDPDAIVMMGLAAARLAGVTSIGPWRGQPVDVDLGHVGVRWRGRARGVVTHRPAHIGSPKLRKQVLHDIQVAQAIAKGAM